MTVEKEMNNGALKLTPVGRLDSLTAGDLESAVNESIAEGVESLTFDMRDVDFISSKGLRVLVGALKKLNGKPVILDHVNASVMEVLKLSGLLTVFQVNG